MDRQQMDDDQRQHLENLRSIGAANGYEIVQRERCAIQVKLELATRFQEDGLRRLAMIREAIEELMKGNVEREDGERREELTHILSNVAPMENMVRKVQENRLNIVLPRTVCTPGTLAKYQEERKAIFVIIDRLAEDVGALVVKETERKEKERMDENEKEEHQVDEETSGETEKST